MLLVVLGVSVATLCNILFERNGLQLLNKDFKSFDRVEGRHFTNLDKMVAGPE